MIVHDRIEAALAASLADRALSLGERRELTALIGDSELRTDERAFVRNRAFDLVTAELGDVGDAALIGWLRDVLKWLDRQEERSDRGPAARPARAFFSPGDACREALVAEIGRCRERLDVCVFTITDDRISGALVDAARRGVAVRVISDNDKAADRGSDIDRLAGTGTPGRSGARGGSRASAIAVRVDRSDAHMHHKFAVFDGGTLATGSFNWTRSASSENAENLIFTSDPGLITAFVAEFEKLWQAGI